MTDDAILDVLRGLVRDRLRLTTPIDMSSDIRRDLQLDSLKALELVVAIEDRFDIQLTPEAEGELKTVGDLVRFVAREHQA